jgi:hypothetical protein
MDDSEGLDQRLSLSFQLLAIVRYRLPGFQEPVESKDDLEVISFRGG